LLSPSAFTGGESVPSSAQGSANLADRSFRALKQKLQKLAISRMNKNPQQMPDDSRLDQAMQWALEDARQAAALSEVPVGAVLVAPDGELMGRAHNEIETRSDPTAHAERLVLSACCVRLGAPRVPPGCLLAVTLEPCAMCAGAIVLARVDHLIFGAADPKTGACGSLRDVVRDPRLNHRVTLHEPRFGEACGQMLTEFFRARRGKGKPHG